MTRLRLAVENRMAVAETQLSDHESRLRVVETNMASLVQTSESTNSMVSKIVPEVLELKKHSKAMKVAKKTSGAGLLLALGGILERYGPDIIRFLVGR
jgi:hypothetical protein